MLDSELSLRAGKLRWFLTDVDGVLTDGRMFYGPQGEALKVFHVRDGLALKLAQKAGIRVGLLSARGGPAVEHRAAELGLDLCLLKKKNKLASFQEFLAENNVEAEAVAYVGDDLQDLLVLTHCGLSFCPADAAPEVHARVDCVLQTAGGKGAVREAIESILKARNAWENLLASYLPAPNS
ncbi:MAG: HAD-IIIA family hydrolase [Deltaproteobacteria bacterium]|nr:HAD-IIIA family hydrolase [Deltaproteobacteria bacterium]